ACRLRIRLRGGPLARLVAQPRRRAPGRWPGDHVGEPVPAAVHLFAGGGGGSAPRPVESIEGRGPSARLPLPRPSAKHRANRQRGAPGAAGRALFGLAGGQGLVLARLPIVERGLGLERTGEIIALSRRTTE